jgi:hypothetical protein
MWKNYAPVQTQINYIVLNNIRQISSNSSNYNIHNKIVPGYRIESTIPTVLHYLWMKFLLMCRPSTFTTVSLIHMGMTVAAHVHCIVGTLIIHNCVCIAILKISVHISVATHVSYNGRSCHRA